MQFKTEKFIPVLFGNDINVYSVARAFYEEYGVKSVVFGKAVIGTCYRSKLVSYTQVDKLDTDEVFVKTINSFAERYSDKAILAIGCGDSYVKVIATNRDKLSENIIVPYADYEFLNNLMDKEEFYKLCDKHSIPYPKTFIITTDNFKNPSVPFDAPYILKPSNQVMYYRNPFEGQKKVFKLDTYSELADTLEKVYNAGYTDHMIIQEFIPGDDTNMRVLTSYSDKNKNVVMMCLGHVLLEEHTPFGIGNHAVIITEDNKLLCKKFKNLLEEIGYTGFSNFDIKFDPRDRQYKVFEINTRQGRSNYYVTAAGHNVAKLFVEDFVNNAEIPLSICEKENLWMVVPKNVAFKYAPDYKSKMSELISSGSYVNPLFTPGDTDLERMLRLFKSQLGHFHKFKKYYRR